MGKRTKCLTVFYAKDPPFAFGLTFPKLTVENLSETHVPVKVFTENTIPKNRDPLEYVFSSMQAEVWSPNGEAKTLLDSLNLTHTSMSIGDVIRDWSNNYFVCESKGWRDFSPYKKEKTDDI